MTLTVTFFGQIIRESGPPVDPDTSPSVSSTTQRQGKDIYVIKNATYSAL